MADPNNEDPPVEGRDYTVTYENNIKCGVGKIVLEAVEDSPYTGRFDSLTDFYIVPEKAEITSLVPGKEKLTVNFRSQEETGIDGYYLSYWETGSEDVQTIELDASDQSAVITGLTTGKEYTVSLKAFIKFIFWGSPTELNGEESDEKTVSLESLPGKTARGDMYNLANNVKVTWKEVSGAKYYKVYREGLTDPSESVAEPVIVTSRLVGWDNAPGLTDGHKYRYKIVASLTGKGDSSGDSPQSYSKDMYRLKAVSINSVRNTAPGSVTVNYNKTANGDSYVIMFSEKEDMSDAKTRVVKPARTTSYVVGGLKKGKTYYFAIRVRKVVDGISYYTTPSVAKKIRITK